MIGSHRGDGLAGPHPCLLGNLLRQGAGHGDGFRPLIPGVLIRGPDALGIAVVEFHHAPGGSHLPLETVILGGDFLQLGKACRVLAKGALGRTQHGGDPDIPLCQLLLIFLPHVLKLAAHQKVLPLQHLPQQGRLQFPDEEHIVDAVLPGNLDALGCLACSGDETLLGVYRNGVQHTHPRSRGQHDKDEEKSKLVFQVPPHGTPPPVIDESVTRFSAASAAWP